MLMAKSMKKMLRQTFSLFEPEQCLGMGNLRASEASETLSGVSNGNRRYIYIYIYMYKIDYS